MADGSSKKRKLRSSGLPSKQQEEEQQDQKQHDGHDTEEKTLPFGPNAQPVPVSCFSALRDSFTTEPISQLRERLAADGYLLVRRLHDRERVQKAAHSLMSRLVAKGLVTDDEDHNLDEGHHTGKPTSSGSRVHLDMQDDAAFSVLFEQDSNSQQFLSDLLDGSATSFDFKFLRCVPPNAGTPVHCDNVYMSRGTSKLLTCWTPITAVTHSRGSLCLCLNSHSADSSSDSDGDSDGGCDTTTTNRSAGSGCGFGKLRQTYGMLDVDRDKVEGSLSNDAIEFTTGVYAAGRWATAEFNQGDAVIFGMHLLHGSLTNVSGTFRISCDTRWQLATDPMDERWVSNGSRGASTEQQKEFKGIGGMREEWGV